MSVPPDSTLADLEQTIADLRRELAQLTAQQGKLLADQDEANRRLDDAQAATAEVLRVINASRGDLAPVFGAILEQAHRICGAELGCLAVYEERQFRAVATHNYPPEYAALIRQPYGAEASAYQRLVNGERYVHIPDVVAVPTPGLEDAIRLTAIKVAGIRTVLLVPLRKENVFLGYFSAQRREVRPYSEREITLIESFAAQAVIAMENARLLAETREALEQQSATAEVLQVINSSPGDLAPVFEAMLYRALALCGAAFGVLRTYDGELVHTVAQCGVPLSLVDFMRKPNRVAAGSASATGALLRGENFVHIADIRDSESYRSGHPFRRALADLGGARTTLWVPLRKDEAFLGAIILYRQETRPFTDKQIALLQNFAEQAVIAMENARLLNEQREALARQTAATEVLEVINASPGKLAPVFDAMLEKAMSLCEASFGSLWTLDGDRFHPVAHRGLPAPYADYLRRDVPTAGTGTGRARLLAGEAFAHIADLADDEPYRTGEPHRRALVDLGGARTALLVPLRRDDTVCGFIMIYRQEVRSFMDKQIALLQTFAAQAVIAMENARLLGELRERTDQVAALNRGLEARVAEQVEELGRVGRLKRFLAPQLAELIVSQGDEKILESHRREIVVVFCDVRGYTAFAETAEPEEVLDFLREYHGALGPLVSQFQGTLDQFSGDGIMVFFNDPLPIPDPAERAVRMAVAMREAASTLIAAWRERGRELGFGVGIAQGYATLGQIGFSERSGYTAIGTVCNVAARLCAEAKDGQVLLSQRVNVALKGSIATEQLGALLLKGLTQPVVAYNVPSTASQPALRVIDGGNH